LRGRSLAAPRGRLLERATVVEMKQEHDCDLVLLGKHGTAVVETLLGSVTRHVRYEGTANVLISARQGRARHPRRRGCAPSTRSL